MFIIATLTLCWFPTVESNEFPPEIQKASLTATVRVKDRDGGRTSSGVLIGVRDQIGYILTSYHGVSRSTHVEVEFFTSDSYPKSAMTLRVDREVAENPAIDLALMKVPLKGLDKVPVPVSIATSVSQKSDFMALNVGSPGGKEPSPEVHQVTGRKLVKREDGTSTFFWETRRAPSVGRSGGPLIDSAGQLIGIASGEQKELGYFVHLDEIRAWLRKANEGKFRWMTEVKKSE